MLKEGSSRHQLEMVSLEMFVSKDSPVRLIDAFVDSLDLSSQGYIIKGGSHTGRQAFSTSSLLKLYLYGYLNRIRSSRKLEEFAKFNVEVMWLLKSLKPCYKTIADFRKENKEAFTRTFEHLISQFKGLNLLKSKIVAQDGTKIRAQNSTKNNYNAKKLAMLLSRLETNIETYTEQLSNNDKLESAEIAQLNEKLKNFAKRKIEYESMEQELAQSDQTQISTVDPDARLYKEQRKTAHVAYNSQILVDSEHKLILAQQVSNLQDEAHLDEMTAQAQEVLDEKKITILADKKYDVAQELAKVQAREATTLVAAKKARKDQKEEGFRTQDFDYDQDLDVYICHNKKQLPRRGKIAEKKKNGKLSYRYYRYRAERTDCIACPFREKCLSKGMLKDQRPREIERHEFQYARDKNLTNLKENPDLYRRRKALVEHPFGTIKRQWGYTYTLLKGLKGVQAEFSLISTCYNLRRMITIKGIEVLIQHFKEKIKQKTATFRTFRLLHRPQGLAA